MSLKVIGAGLPRTGTLSMKAALEQLGFGRCYHMTEVFDAPWRSEAWTRCFKGEPVDWDQVFEGFGAAVDAPACVVWPALAERYPEAKVVLTVRDRDAWYESMINTVMSQQHRDSLAASPLAPMFEAMRGMQLAGAPVQDGPPPPGPPPKEMLFAMFERQRQNVAETLPKERWLEFDVREGWAPLCRFLGVDEPDGPFPRVNESGSFHDRFSPAAPA